jgi:hypothetical protein
MNLSSVKELETQNAADRKQLMLTLYKHLNQSGIDVELNSEAATNFLDMTFQELVIKVKNKNLNIIRLVGLDSDGCGVPGNITRFQYEVHLNKNISDEVIKKIDAETRLIKEGKIIGFGGKVVGVNWVGNELAERLNNNTKLSESMLKCTKSWSHMEFTIQATSARVDILGPRFVEPLRIVELYETESKSDIECCLFGFQIVEKIAGQIRDFVS